jgi:hypothetical protein
LKYFCIFEALLSEEWVLFRMADAVRTGCHLSLFLSQAGGTDFVPMVSMQPFPLG